MKVKLVDLCKLYFENLFAKTLIVTKMNCDVMIGASCITIDLTNSIKSSNYYLFRI